MSAIRLAAARAVEPRDGGDRATDAHPASEIVGERERLVGGLDIADSAALRERVTHEIFHLRHAGLNGGVGSGVALQQRGPEGGADGGIGKRFFRPETVGAHDVALGGDASGRERLHVAGVVDRDVRKRGVNAGDQREIAVLRALAKLRKRLGLRRACGRDAGKPAAHDIGDTGFAGRADIHFCQFAHVGARLQMCGGAQRQQPSSLKELIQAVEHVEVAQSRGAEPAIAAFEGHA